MPGLFSSAGVLAAVVVSAALAALVLFLRARARRRRRARAWLAELLNVYETPPSPTTAARRPEVVRNQPEREPPEVEASAGGPAHEDAPEEARKTARREAHQAAHDPALDGAPAGREATEPAPRPRERDRALAELDGWSLARALVPSPRQEGEFGPPRQRDRPPRTQPEPPYPGAAYPLPDGCPPSGQYQVKADLVEGAYYTDDSPEFPHIVPQIWFRTSEDAERAGFARA